MGEIGNYSDAHYLHEEKGVIFQPQVSKLCYYENNQLKLTNAVIWNKLVRKEVYLKLYNELKHKINGENWNYYDDTLWSFIALKNSRSYIFTRRLGYFFYNNYKSLRKGNHKGKIKFMLNNCLSYVEVLFNILLRNENSQQIFILEFEKCLKRDELFYGIDNKIAFKILYIGKLILYDEAKFSNEKIVNFLNGLEKISEINNDSLLKISISYKTLFLKNNLFPFEKKDYLKSLSRECEISINNLKKTKNNDEFFYNKSINNPKISVTIPAYNCENFLPILIKSIQKQSLDEIEIIIVDDYSTDNSVDILEELSNKDKRIKIYKNKINRGILYTRSIGVMKSKGKYILNIDSDDILYNSDILKICYSFAIKYNIDIVEFNSFKKVSGSFVDMNIDHIPFKIIYQKELSNRIFRDTNNQYKRNPVYLWNELIKSEIYIKALNFLGKKIWTAHQNSISDRTISFSLFKFAKNFMGIPIYGYFYRKHYNQITGSFSFSQAKADKRVDDICKYLINLFRLSNNDKTEKTNSFIDFIYHVNFNFPFIRKKSSKCFLELIKNFLQCKYITFTQKKIIKELEKKLKSIYL